MGTPNLSSAAESLAVPAQVSKHSPWLLPPSLQSGTLEQELVPIENLGISAVSTGLDFSGDGGRTSVAGASGSQDFFCGQLPKW